MTDLHFPQDRLVLLTDIINVRRTEYERKSYLIPKNEYKERFCELALHNSCLYIYIYKIKGSDKHVPYYFISILDRTVLKAKDAGNQYLLSFSTMPEVNLAFSFAFDRRNWIDEIRRHIEIIKERESPQKEPPVADPPQPVANSPASERTRSDKESEEEKVSPPNTPEEKYKKPITSSARKLKSGRHSLSDRSPSNLPSGKDSARKTPKTSKRKPGELVNYDSPPNNHSDYQMDFPREKYQDSDDNQLSHSNNNGARIQSILHEPIGSSSIPRRRSQKERRDSGTFSLQLPGTNVALGGPGGGRGSPTTTNNNEQIPSRRAQKRQNTHRSANLRTDEFGDDMDQDDSIVSGPEPDRYHNQDHHRYEYYPPSSSNYQSRSRRHDEVDQHDIRNRENYRSMDNYKPNNFQHFDAVMTTASSVTSISPSQLERKQLSTTDDRIISTPQQQAVPTTFTATTIKSTPDNLLSMTGATYSTPNRSRQQGESNPGNDSSAKKRQHKSPNNSAPNKTAAVSNMISKPTVYNPLSEDVQGVPLSHHSTNTSIASESIQSRNIPPPPIHSQYISGHSYYPDTAHVQQQMEQYELSISLLTNEIQALTAMNDELNNAIEENDSLHQEERQSIVQKLSQLQEVNDKLVREKQQYLSENRDYFDLSNKHQALQEKLNAQHKEYQLLQDEKLHWMQDKQALNNEKQQYLLQQEKFQQEIITLQLQNEKKQQELTAQHDTIIQLQHTVQGHLIQNQQHAESITAMKKENFQLSHDKSQLEKKVKSYEKELTQLQKSQEEMELLHQQIRKYKEDVAHYTKAFELNNLQLKQQESLVAEKRNYIEDLKSQMKNLQTYQVQAEESQVAVKQLEEKLQRANAEIMTTQEDLQRSQKHAKQLEKDKINLKDEFDSFSQRKQLEANQSREKLAKLQQENDSLVSF
jgi:hypothetical protein